MHGAVDGAVREAGGAERAVDNRRLVLVPRRERQVVHARVDAAARAEKLHARAQPRGTHTEAAPHQRSLPARGADVHRRARPHAAQGNIGGEPHDGILQIVSNNGEINTDSQYPYVSGKTGKLSKCSPRPNPVQTGITGYANITSGDEDALAQATYSHASISVGIDASSFGFQLYAGGVYNDDKCKNAPDKLDHGVTVVGYGAGDPKPPGPPGPKPGPANCEDNHYKTSCTKESGCNWCVDHNNFG